MEYTETQELTDEQKAEKEKRELVELKAREIYEADAEFAYEREGASYIFERDAALSVGMRHLVTAPIEGALFILETYHDEAKKLRASNPAAYEVAKKNGQERAGARSVTIGQGATSQVATPPEQ